MIMMMMWGRTITTTKKGSHRKRMAHVRPQVHASLRPLVRVGEQPQRGLAHLHTVPRVHVAVDSTVSVRVRVQRAFARAASRARLLVSVRHVRGQLRERPGRDEVLIYTVYIIHRIQSIHLHLFKYIYSIDNKTYYYILFI